jgi:hypothetical protein
LIPFQLIKLSFSSALFVLYSILTNRFNYSLWLLRSLLGPRAKPNHRSRHSGLGGAAVRSICWCVLVCVWFPKLENMYVLCTLVSILVWRDKHNQPSDWLVSTLRALNPLRPLYSVLLYLAKLFVSLVVCRIYTEVHPHPVPHLTMLICLGSILHIFF